MKNIIEVPELLKSNVGSLTGTTGDEGKKTWPFFFTKKSINVLRTRLTGQVSAADLPPAEAVFSKTENFAVLETSMPINLQYPMIVQFATTHDLFRGKWKIPGEMKFVVPVVEHILSWKAY